MKTDRIDKEVVLDASRERVWRTISDASEFGTWFGVAFDDPFKEGAWLTGRIVPTTVDPEIAKLQEPHAGMAFKFLVESIQPMQKISFRWHPFPVNPGVEKEPTTLIVFELDEVSGGVLLTTSESGFDQIPIERRAKAREANEGGWTMQTKLIGKYLATQPVE
jgi:uncharacterized protein YndB with AHSA1/START domain